MASNRLIAEHKRLIARFKPLTGRSVAILELCARMPFISAHEISALFVIPLVGAREQMRLLSSRRYLSSVTYSALDARPLGRWHLTSLGVAALADALGSDVESVLSNYPVSLHWQRKIGRRIDTAAVFYSLAAAASRALGRRCEWRWRDRGWNDGCLDLGGGRFVHAARIGAGVDKRGMASKMGGMVAEANRFSVDTALFIAPSYTDMRYMERWLRSEARGIYCWVAREADVLSAPNSEVWGRPSSLWVRAKSLDTMLSEVGVLEGDALRLASGLGGVEGVSGRRLPVDISELERERSLAEISVTGKRLFSVIADWPLGLLGDLALIANIKPTRFVAARRELVGAGLIRNARIDGGHWKRSFLTDEGLRAIAWRDRVRLGDLRKDWGCEVDEDGRRVIGGGRKLLTLHKRIVHTDGTYKFAGMLSAESAAAEGVELLELLPEHRSERWFAEGKKRPFGVCPDMSGAFRFGGKIVPFLVEYERRGIAPSLILGKLNSYRRYYGASLRMEAWGVIALTLIVFSDSAMASRFVNFCERDDFDLKSAGGVGFPIYVSSLNDLEALGAFAEAWFRVGMADKGRVAFLSDRLPNAG